ncbi:Monocarboxylate transporter 12-B [Schistosoma japonicum]|nr:Monocarboxylate transporter 12-B [Schistosoma japonicum]KAH8856949.1 Monocarboxylate transporter 12-B [Schistosoma japonicum]
MTDEPIKVCNATVELTDGQNDQPTTEDVDQLQREASEDSTGSEDLRLFLKELHEKVREDHHQQQQQIQQSQAHAVIPPSGHLQPTYMINPGELSIGASSTAVPSYYSSQGNFKANQVIQYQTTGQGTTTDQYYHTSIGELNAQEVVSDGGWGWFVVLGSFCCMVLVDGICFTYGLLLNPICPYSHLRVLSYEWKSNETGPINYPRNDRTIQPLIGSCIPISELGEDFQTQQRSILLIPGGLIVGLYLFLGPLVSALSNQFDFRPVAMIGAIITTIALLSSAFVTSIELFILTFGLLGGIGLSFIYLPAIATVGHWFQQKRPLAVGLALCGSGMGCLVGGQAVPRLLVLFTWRGTLIIMAAVCFQCLTLILLFRPWDVHFQITQVQKVKRLAREAARRAAALRRAEAERVLLEARRRKYLAALEAAATAHSVGMKKHSNTTPVVMNNNTSGKTGRSDSSDSGVSGVSGSRRNTAQYNRIHNINQINNGRQNKHFIFNTHNRAQQSAGVQNTRSNATTGNRPVNHHNPGSSRMANRKRAPSRRVIVYRGSIMQRIIEEKRRQRTISVGSLDGMVITRDNELIAASKIVNQDKPLYDPATIQKISENVARKIEAKLSSTIAPNLSIIAGGNNCNINSTNNSGAVVTPGGTPILGSRTGFRVSLPQLVQEYIQSQLSVTLQQQQQLQPKLSSVASLMNTNNNHVNSPSTPADNFIRSPSVTSRLSTAIIPNYDPATVQLASSINENGAHSDSGSGQGGGLTLAKHVLPADNVNTATNAYHQMIPVSTLGTITNSPALSSGTTNLPTTALPGHDVTSTRLHPIRSISETVSLRRTTSDASLTSHLTSFGAVESNYNPAVVGDLLDDDIKADIQLLVRKEMSRPQYKKDFFYTGSIRHVTGDPTSLSKLPTSHKLSVNLPILPTTVVERPNRSSTSFRLPSTFLPSDSKQEHCSQTNLSVTNSTNLFANQFIPPAPCPSIPFTSQQSVVHNVPLTTGLPLCGTNVNYCGGSINAGRIDSVLHSNYTDNLEASTTATTNQPDLCEKVDCGNSVANANEQQQLPEELIDFGVDIDIGDEEDDDGGVVELGLDDDIEGDDDNRDGVLMDDDDDNQALYTRCPKCLHHCCRMCGNVLFCCWGCSPMGTFIQDLLSPKILSSLTFLFFLFSSMAAMLGLVIPFLMIPDLLAEMNWKLEDSGFIISSIGAGNTFGRLFATFYIEKAWSTTYKWADSLWMNNFSLFLTSVTVFILPAVRRYYAALVLVSCAFGLFSAVFVSLKSILVVELIGIDRLTNAFGYLLLFQGCAAAIGPSVAGYLRDMQIDKTPVFSISTVRGAPVHDASKVAFLFSATALLISCILGCPLRWLSRREFSSNSKSIPYNPNEFAPNHVDPTSYGHEYNAMSPPVMPMDHEYHLQPQQQQLPNIVNENQAVDMSHMATIDSGSTSRRFDVGDHYITSQAVVVPPLASLTFIDALKPQTAVGQLSPSVMPQPSVNGLPLSGHHILLPAAPTSTLASATTVVVAGPLDTTSVTGSIPMTDESVSLVNVAGSVPTPVSLSLPAQAVEVLEVKEDSGLEPVVEEEEEEEYDEDYEDDEHDASNQYTRVNALESGTLSLLTEQPNNTNNIDSSIPTSQSSFNQDTGDLIPTNDSSSLHGNNNSRKDVSTKHKRRRASKPFELAAPIAEDKPIVNVIKDNDAIQKITVTTEGTTALTTAVANVESSSSPPSTSSAIVDNNNILIGNICDESSNSSSDIKEDPNKDQAHVDNNAK